MSRPRPVARWLLALSAPLLVLLSLVSLFSRHGSQRLQAVPALLIGAGLLVSSGVRRARHRRLLVEALRTAPTASETGPAGMGR